jgi:hypothetical protein
MVGKKKYGEEEYGGKKYGKQIREKSTGKYGEN